MEVSEIIELIGVIVAIIFGGISWYYSCKAKKIAENANKLSEESIKEAKEANNLAKESNKLAEKSIKIAEETLNKNNENIVLKSPELPMIFNNTTETKKFILGKPDYSDYIFVSKIQITNCSLQPVTIKKFNCYIGKGADNICLFLIDDDLVDIKSYTPSLNAIKLENVNYMPIYLAANEMKEVTIAIGIDKASYQQYYAKGGMLVEFETTSSKKEIFISSKYTSEY